MPSIIELFESKKLNSGQTAKEQYDIQNLKPIPIKTNSGAIDVLATPINILRRNVGSRLKETRLEQEVLGIRGIRAFSSPVLYGTAIAKLKLKQSSSVVTMKNAASTLISTDGQLSSLVNKLVDKAKEVGKSVLSKLGIQLPEAQLPTRVAGKIKAQLLLSGGPISPQKLKQIQQASQGNGAGRILASIGQGATGEQIKNQVLGAGINAAKKAATKALFGAVDRVAKSFKSVEPSATVSIRKSDTTYTSKRKYSKILKIRSREDGAIDDFGNYTSLKGLQDYINKPISIGGGLLGMLAGLTQPEGLFLMNRSVSDATNYADPTSKLSFPEFPEFSLASITQNIPNKKDFTKVYSKSDAVKGFLIDSENKPKFKGKKDLVNLSKPWYSEAGEPEPFADGTLLDDYDFIPLRFYSLNKKTGVSFKATISGLNESISPSWDSNRFLGNPYNFYTYNSVERSVSFNFKVYSLNQSEHISCWQKLNFLAGLAYPQTSVAQVYTIPPFIKFTLGDMYRNKECFIETLSFEVDDNTPWEIGLNPSPAGRDNQRIGAIAKNGLAKDYKLPTIVNVNVNIKFIETQGSVVGKRLYAYDRNNPNGSNESDYGFLPDGAAIKSEPTAKQKNSYFEDFSNL
jgi:hypothetical protein